MNNLNVPNDGLGENKHPNLSNSSVNKLIATAKWAKFLAVLNLLALGTMTLVASFLMGNGVFSIGMGGPFNIGLTFLIIIAIVALPILYLYRFSNNLRDGLELNNQQNIEKGFDSLKNYFMIIGIYIIIGIIVYSVILIYGFFN